MVTITRQAINRVGARVAFKFQVFDFDFRNDQFATQKTTIDTFFQANAVECWSISENETIVVTYDDGVATKPTRFDAIDFGVAGVKSDITAANANATLDTLVAGSHIIQQQLAENRVLALQYKEGVIAVDTLAENQRVSDEDLAVVASPVYAEIAATALGTQQTGINGTYSKVDQFNTIVRSKNITVSGPNSNLTINVDGLFFVVATVSFTGTANTNFEISPHVNDTQIGHITSVRKTGPSAGDVGNVTMFGTSSISAGDVVDLRVSSDDVTGADFRVVRANFVIQKVR